MIIYIIFDHYVFSSYLIINNFSYLIFSYFIMHIQIWLIILQ